MSFSNKPDLERFLERLTGRSVLTGAEQQAILDLPGRIGHVQANHDFVALGETVHHACLVVNGIVGRFCQTTEGHRQITAFYIPGDMADLNSVVQPASTCALQALSIATILKVPHDALRDAMARYPALAEAFWRDCAVETSVLAQWVANIGRRDARTRIAHLFCEMATRLRAAPVDGRAVYPFAVTQTHLADATGMTSVHVNRTLQDLRSEGLIEVTRHAVSIPDWNALMAIGGFDASYLHLEVQPQGRPQITQAR